LATPTSRQRAKADEETSGGIASVLGAIMQRTAAPKLPPRKAIDSELAD
jgi:hypothetical protein